TKMNLLEQITDGERQLAVLSQEYDRRLAATRRAQTLTDSEPRASTKQLQSSLRPARDAFRKGFVVGLALTLLVGLLVMVAR
ncbi:MAG TPA: hypothetical protein VHU40_08190, partial [Polyangia bacterium]|nr:hypothetical protein [Polyangia bacterium]